MECCIVPGSADLAKSKASTICGMCGGNGKRVERITVEHIVKTEHQHKITDTQYYFCETPSCEVVYFSNGAGQYFAISEVRVRVGLKETEDPVQICYCFDFTEQMVRDELITKGHTVIPDFITTEIQAGTCACEVKNPSGRCCLGEVNEVVKLLRM